MKKLLEVREFDKISYNPDYGKKGCTTTNKLNAYIGRQCLDCSPKTVADELGGIVSKNTVSNIFKAWSDNCLEHYESAMIAPENIGIHCIKVFKNSIVSIPGGNIINSLVGNTYSVRKFCLCQSFFLS